MLHTNTFYLHRRLIVPKPRLTPKVPKPVLYELAQNLVLQTCFLGYVSPPPSINMHMKMRLSGSICFTNSFPCSINSVNLLSFRLECVPFLLLILNTMTYLTVLKYITKPSMA